MVGTPYWVGWLHMILLLPMYAGCVKRSFFL
jgi:hypothetical protein